MQALDFLGPIGFADIGKIEPQVNGVYLWCVKGTEGFYRVHYIGQSGDVARRILVHRRNQLAGKYTGFCPDELRKGLKRLKHRAGQGMIAKYADEERQAFNEAFLSAIDLFYAKLEPDADAPLRCRYEYALYVAVEDFGPHILYVGHLRAPTGEPFDVRVQTGSSHIQALTNASIRV